MMVRYYAINTKVSSKSFIKRRIRFIVDYIETR